MGILSFLFVSFRLLPDICGHLSIGPRTLQLTHSTNMSFCRVPGTALGIQWYEGTALGKSRDRPEGSGTPQDDGDGRFRGSRRLPERSDNKQS